MSPNPRRSVSTCYQVLRLQPQALVSLCGAVFGVSSHTDSLIWLYGCKRELWPQGLCFTLVLLWRIVP